MFVLERFLLDEPTDAASSLLDGGGKGLDGRPALGFARFFGMDQESLTRRVPVIHSKERKMRDVDESLGPTVSGKTV
jgi:hypothetical protein